MEKRLRVSGLWIPLITPFFQGQLDEESLVNLIKYVEPHVEGVVPCLSSGEGAKMTDELWERIVTVVVATTNKKPVAAGILAPSLGKIIELSEKAKALGCRAVVIPLQGENDEAQKKFCQEISTKSHLPIILYNTEKIHMENVDTLIGIAHYQNIIALKDSSRDQRFFSEVLEAKKESKISLSILQGMEDRLLESVGCDGYLIALANVEPRLCKEMFNNSSKELNDEIVKKWDELNLASETWFVGVKQALVSRGKIKSAELIS